MQRVAEGEGWKWILGGLAVLYLFRDQLPTIGASAGNALTQTAIGVAQGAGAAINAAIINPIAQAATGNPNATAGSATYDMLHYQQAPADVTAILPAAIYIDYTGNLYASDRSSLVGYVTDDQLVRDVGGRVKGGPLDGSELSAMNGFNLPNFQSILNGNGGYSTNIFGF